MAGLEKKVKKAFIIPSFSWSNQEEFLRRGKTPVWDCDIRNEASMRLACSVGFEIVGTHPWYKSEDGIYTHEGNEYVPTWNHRIVLEEISPDQCLYSDIVEIEAGWKTIFVYLWARCFYAHRQRKWIRLLSKGTKS